MLRILEIPVLFMGLWILAMTGPSFATTQHDVDYIGKYLDLRYEVMGNWVYGYDRFLVHLDMTNSGAETISKGEWSIYFCHIWLIEAFHTDPDPEHLPESAGMKIVHRNGCQHELIPLMTFQAIAPGATLKVPFTVWYASVAKPDIQPNWYVAAGTSTPRTIASTAGESLDFVAPFVRPEQVSRYNVSDTNSIDQHRPYSPSERFEKHHVTDLGADKVKYTIIPTPQQMTLGSGYVRMDTGDWVIVLTPASESLRTTATYISDVTRMSIVSSKPLTRFIELRLGNNFEATTEIDESYTLEVIASIDYVRITASTSQGAFYAFQSLLHLAGKEWKVPEVVINDAPRFAYRGVELDVARHFFSKTEVMLLLDVMAKYKLNKFNFHLSDDEGWRLEIPELPELTRIGSRRCHDPEETQCLMSQLASGPTDQNSGSGFYTETDYREILEYAAERHIEVIPQFETPGHAHSQIKSMLARYRELTSRGDTSASDFLLHDLDDTSVYMSPQWFYDDAMNPCLESTYKFLETIIKTVKRLHGNTNPLKTIQLLGANVASGTWENSTKCAEFRMRNPDINSRNALLEYYIKRVTELSNRYGLTTSSGQEFAMLPNKLVPIKLEDLSDQDIYVYVWYNVWTWDGGYHAYSLANAGYKVIMGQATHLFFNFPHEPHPEERGYYWANRFSDTHRVFSFMPDDIYANADMTTEGHPMTSEIVCGKDNTKCPPLLIPDNIVGMQGYIWTEIHRNKDQLEQMIFPKLLALAERAWHRASWEGIQEDRERKRQQRLDWTQFANTLGYKGLAKLDDMGILYYIPPPGAKLDSGRLIVTSAFPGLQVEYSPDGGQSWYTVTDREIQLGEILLRTRSADGSRISRVVTMSVPLTSKSQISAIPGISMTIMAFIFAMATDIY